jgi:membrane-associated phospholipid phosphatase
VLNQVASLKLALIIPAQRGGRLLAFMRPASTGLHSPTQAPAPPVRAPWLPELAWRMRSQLLIKVLGISGFMWLFFLGYFHTLREPVYAVQVMPLTALDHAIGFQPWALPLYVSLWFYVSIPAGLMLSLRDLVVYGLWAGGLCVTGLLLFYFFPTAVPRAATLVDVAQHPGFALLQGVDAAGNACPSLHVATAVFTALWMQRLMRNMGAPRLLRVVNVLWLLLIVYSTLAIKQHVVWDVVGGTVLGAVFGLASLRWFPAPLAWRR